jgi:hypothetical protein
MSPAEGPCNAFLLYPFDLPALYIAFDKINDLFQLIISRKYLTPTRLEDARG